MVQATDSWTGWPMGWPVDWPVSWPVGWAYNGSCWPGRMGCAAGTGAPSEGGFMFPFLGLADY